MTGKQAEQRDQWPTVIPTSVDVDVRDQARLISHSTALNVNDRRTQKHLLKTIKPKENSTAEHLQQREEQLATTSFSAAHVRPVQKPATFDGRSPWEPYHTQFEIAAEINNWSDERLF